MTFQKHIRLLSFLSLLLISACRIVSDFPKSEGFSMAADEGVYFRQGQVVKSEGLAGYKHLLKDYLGDENLQLYPGPLRVLHIGFVSVALCFHNGITSLATISLCWFICLCLICWHFIRKLWGERLAFTTCSLLCFAPLLSGMARRALMDSEVAFFSLLALFLLLAYCKTPSRSNAIGLLLALTACLLLKETLQVIYPFFPACLFFAYWQGRLLRVLPIFVITVVPVLIAGLAYIFLFGGLQGPAMAYQLMGVVNLQHPMPYVRDFGSGPWYQYFIDFFLLSPVVSIGFFLGTGLFLGEKGEKDFSTICLLGYMTWLILTHVFIPKNIRYAISLEPIYVLMTSLFLLKLTSRIGPVRIRNLILGLCVAGIVLLELGTYQHFFIEANMYDPVSANLLKAMKMIP